MKILLTWLLATVFLFANDATIEVIKKVETLPSIAIEESSSSYDDTFRLTFFKSLVADLNVISLFNVDRHYRKTDYEADDVVVENKDMKYVLRYKIFEDDNGYFNVKMKLLKDAIQVLNKNYKIKKKNIYMFISHTIAYDINEFMGEPSVEWMKRKVIFSRIVAPKKSELVISDYTLTYQHVVVSGGFNVFPKWANTAQNMFYYTSLDGAKPSLKKVDMRLGTSVTLLSSDGMIICSDVSNDSTKLLLSMAPNGQADIYLYDVQSKKYSKVTKYSGIDVNGQFVDNKNIVFISNRLGYPNVFSKNIASNDVEQMLYYGKSNAACSAHNEYIVYKARESSNAFSGNTFNLHLISTKTDFIRRLTATGVNEFPRFSKDGDAIIFIKNYKAQSSIGIIRLNYNKNYLFPLKHGTVQAMDW
ncbi:MAG: Tol-Pal system protein TolB [Sulfurimonas sp.]|nr:Tol-Pal system protein TolB [Sulfurimonas sp.]MDQ7062493.1 Tol-Pal system protein TolB [Sulfurimonas sp.]